MKKENNAAEFSLQAIRTEQFAILEENYKPKKETELFTELQFRLDQDQQIIAVFQKFEFAQGKNTFIKLLISCHFSIDKKYLDSYINKDKLIAPKALLTHLAMISTGTARGILFARTESGPFAKFIIPFINVTEIVKGDITFELSPDQ